MKKPEKVAAFLVFWFFRICGAILTGYEQPETDITMKREYGCEWSGGTSAYLTCTCASKDTEMVILENSIPPYSTEGIEIQDCSRVHFAKNSIHHLRSLRFLNLRNIPSLEFAESSLYWSGYLIDVDLEDIGGPGMPSLKVTIENSNITQLSSYTFKGYLSEIIMKGVIVESIATYAFTSLMHTRLISIEDAVLKDIRPQPFKKLNIQTLILKNVSADLVPSRTFSNITVYDNFILNRCNFNIVRPAGFMIYNPENVEVANTKINQLDGEAFTIVTRGGVLFKNNTFHTVNDGAFKGIVLNKNEVVRNKHIVFDSNTFTVLTRDSLTVSDLIPKFTNIIINEECDCKKIEHNLKNSEFYSEIKCLHGNSYVTVTNYKNNWCSVIASYSTTIIIVSVVLVLIFIISIALFMYYKRVYLSRKYGSEKKPKNNLSLIVPDGRTYRETELHVIVERADLLTTDL